IGGDAPRGYPAGGRPEAAMRRDALGAIAGRDTATGSRSCAGHSAQRSLGARSNDLPGVLPLLADHYRRTNALWTRLTGLMVYPLIVILVSLALTVLISLNFSHFMAQFMEHLGQIG